MFFSGGNLEQFAGNATLAQNKLRERRRARSCHWPNLVLSCFPRESSKWMITGH
jgi:hypothetical protein